MDPLAQLNDIQTPGSVDWWPLAWGWWVSAILLLAVVGLIIYRIVKHYRFNRARKQAVALHQSYIDDEHYPAKANQLLKRVALHYFGADKTAALYGEDWLTLLLSAAPARKQEALKDGLSLLLSNSYHNAPLNTEQRELMFRSVNLWLTHARLQRLPETASVSEGHTNV